MISDKDVQYIAGLARMSLKEEEIPALSKNLEDILGYVSKLENLDVSNVEPMSHVLPLENVYREDQIKPSLDQSEALKFSIEQHKGSFKVPKVID